MTWCSVAVGDMFAFKNYSTTPLYNCSTVHLAVDLSLFFVLISFSELQDRDQN